MADPVASPGLTDRFGRSIRYLRISVTDRCNLRCVYCVAAGEFKWKRHEDILSYEEIADSAAAALRAGMDKIRITGGEPLVRRDVVRLVEMISGLPGLRDFALTTNGVLLESHARELKGAGLMRINISLDSLNPETYRNITGGGDLAAVLRGIEAAQKAGLDPVKLNCVILPGINGGEAERLRSFARERGLEIRFIQRMHLGAEKPEISDPKLASRPPDCRSCDRLRLTADGRIKPCLLSDYSLALRGRGGSIEEAFREAVRNKPERGKRLTVNSMMEVGG